MAAGDLTDLATVEAWLGVPSDGGATDALISRLISAASQWVKSYINRDLVQTSYTETRPGSGHDFMLLANGPVIAVTSVAWVGTTITTVGDPIAGTPGFYVDPTDPRRLALVGYCFPRRTPVRVVYSAGYATIPADIVQGVCEIVGEAFRRRDRIGQNSKTLGGQETVSFSTADIPATTKTLLAQYKSVAPV